MDKYVATQKDRQTEAHSQTYSHKCIETHIGIQKDTQKLVLKHKITLIHARARTHDRNNSNFKCTTESISN